MIKIKILKIFEVYRKMFKITKEVSKSECVRNMLRMRKKNLWETKNWLNNRRELIGKIL
jgi:hypothetical protein